MDQQMAYVMTSIWLLWCSIEDIRTQSISRITILIGVAMVLLDLWLLRDISYLSKLIGVGIGFLFYIIYKITRGQIEIADGIIIGIIGASYGGEMTISMVFTSMFAVVIVSIILIVVKRVSKNTRLPYIPFLFLGWMGTFL